MRSACDGIVTVPSLPTARMRLPSISTVLPGADCPVAASKTFAFVIATGCFGLRVSVRARSTVRALASASCFSSSFGTLDSQPSRTTE